MSLGDFVVGVVHSLIPGKDTAPFKSHLTVGDGSSSASYMGRELAGELSFCLTYTSIHLLLFLLFFLFIFLIFLIWEANLPVQCILPVLRPTPTSFLSTVRYKINLYSSKWGVGGYLFFIFLLMYFVVICYSSQCCIIYLLCL